MAVHLRQPHKETEEHFGPSDPNPRRDLTRFPWVRRMFKSRIFQFAFILPNQIIFWLVIFTGLFGAALPTRNFATVITWYIWFCVVFLLMVGVGRGWCLMCPFGGFGEWVQRHTLWARTTRAWGLARRWGPKLSRYGIMPSVLMFIGLTWFEEYFNIAAPGVPRFTSYLVIFIISLATVSFLWLERRSFCRYLCPLTALIGTVGTTGMISGFRSKNRDICLSCATKDCIRGSEQGFGCPWYEWPGSATSNASCGLCTECFKSCPYDNIGLFVQAPLTSVIQPTHRRWDFSIAVLSLFGLVVFQQINAMPLYATIDNWLNKVTSFPGYPNPIDYLAAIAGFVLVAGIWILGVKVVAQRPVRAAKGTFFKRYASWLNPIAYGLTPLMAADYLSRQLPRFFDHALRIVPAISDPFGIGWNLFGTAHSSLYHVHLLSVQGVINAQLIVTVIGTIGALYATWRITSRDLAPMSRSRVLVMGLNLVFVLACGAAVYALYIAMGGAQ